MGTLYKLSIEPILPLGMPDTIPSSSENPSITLAITTNLSSNLAPGNKFEGLLVFHREG